MHHLNTQIRCCQHGKQGLFIVRGKMLPILNRSTSEEICITPGTPLLIVVQLALLVDVRFLQTCIPRYEHLALSYGRCKAFFTCGLIRNTMCINWTDLQHLVHEAWSGDTIAARESAWNLRKQPR